MQTILDLYEAKASANFPNKNTDKDRLSYLITQVGKAKSVWGFVMISDHDGEYVRLSKADLIKKLKDFLLMHNYDYVNLETFKVRGWDIPNGTRSMWVN